MKHFKLIGTVSRIIIPLLFGANIVFMWQLYNSIKERYINDIEQSLHRADQIEMVDRIADAKLGDENDVVWLEIGLQKSDVGKATSADQLLEIGYSQGYRRTDNQFLSVISQYLHNNFGDSLDQPDLANMEEAFRRDLNFSGYYPPEVHIVTPEDSRKDYPHLWKLEYRVNGKVIYLAYLSPLTNNILHEMSGVIITSVLIALTLILGFRYLLHVINSQRTIEEMKDDFTNNMTHELKTPIAIAYAANDALLQFPDPADEERTRKYLSSAIDQLTKLTGLVENILAMSMERRKHLSMSKEMIRLYPFLSSIIDQQKLRATKPCEIILYCPTDATLITDPTHFSNIIGNLIDNSLKYSGEEVRIIIEADEKSISVSDNGIGIPEKSLPEIFNKFYRVPHGNHTDVRGYGIGLFYVKSIVDKHGWTIRVESKSGKGSRFIIKFSTQ